MEKLIKVSKERNKRINKIEKLKQEHSPKEAWKKLEYYAEKGFSSVPEHDLNFFFKCFGVFYRPATPEKFMIRDIEEGSIKPKPGITIVEAYDKMLNGEIKLLWNVCTNPVVSAPNLNKFWKALRNIFVIVQDAYLNDMVDFANLVLPATQWGEKEGVMTGSDRTITYNKSFKQPPSQCKHDWQIFCEVAKKLGWEDKFDYKNSREIFDEYKQTTKGRLCDISDWNYEDLPNQWGGKWLYKDKKFPTHSGRAKFNPAKFENPADKLEYPFSFILTTGRTKKQWHTMTRTGKAFELLRGEEEPFILFNEEDAYELGIIDGDYINVQSKRGKVYIKAKLGNIRRGVVFAPFGYGLIYHFPTNILVSDAIDPISKEPDLKFSAVYIKSKRIPITKVSDESLYIVQTFISSLKRVDFQRILYNFYKMLVETNEKFRNFINDENIGKFIKEDMEVYGNINSLKNIENILQKRAELYFKNKVYPEDYKEFSEIFLKNLKIIKNLRYVEYEAWKEVLNYILNLIKIKMDKIYSGII